MRLGLAELEEARLEVLSAAPSNPLEGQIYFDSTLDRARIYDGVGWRNLNVDATRIFRAVIDGGGVAIATGAKQVYITVPFACVITKWRLLGTPSGSIVIDIWKDTYANFPPTVADTITASAKPTLSNAQKNESSILTGWTTSIATGDILEVNVDSAATVTKVMLDLYVTAT